MYPCPAPADTLARRFSSVVPLVALFPILGVRRPRLRNRIIQVHSDLPAEQTHPLGTRPLRARPGRERTPEGESFLVRRVDATRHSTKYESNNDLFRKG